MNDSERMYVVVAGSTVSKGSGSVAIIVVQQAAQSFPPVDGLTNSSNEFK